MPEGKLKNAIAGLGSTIKARGGEAWGSYKGLLSGNRRGAMIGLGVAAGYGAYSEGPSIIGSSVVLGPALMGIGAALSAGGGVGMLRGKGAQAAAAYRMMSKAPTDWKGDAGAAYRSKFQAEVATNPFMKGFGGVSADMGNQGYLARTLPNTDYAGIASKALAGVTGEVPMSMQYAAIAAEMNMVPGEDAIVTLGQLAQDKQLGGFAGKFSTKEAIMSRIDESPEFARQFTGRMDDFEGVTGFSTMTGIKPAGKARHIGLTRGSLIEKLTAQGHGALAGEIAGIDRGVRITGIGTSAGDAISAIQYEVGGQTFRAPVVGPDGVVKAGLFGKNTNVARRQIFIGSLEGMAAGGRPQVVAMDVAVAKTLRTYHAAAGEVEGGRRMLANYLADMANLPIRGLPAGMGISKDMGRAMSWSSPYRGDRIGVPTSANVAIRSMDAQLSMPGRGLRRLLNLEGFMDKDIVSADTILALRAGGLAPLGSEGAVRTNTFVNINEMASMFPGSYMTPMDKAARGPRDYGKPYYVTGGGGLQRRPFASRTMNKKLGTSQGMAMHYNAIFESEAQFLSEMLNTGKSAGVNITPKANKMIEGIMGQSMSTSELRELRGGLQQLANMREGQFATAIPEGVMMRTDVEKVVYTVPEDIAGLKRGQAMPSNRPIGFDAANRPVDHTYRRLGGGTARFTSITPLQEGTRTAYLIRWSEEQAASNVKWGSDVGKMFALNMKESQTPLVMRFINKLRRNQQLGERLYGNQSYAPLIGGVDNVVEAFTLAGTFGKMQGGPQILSATIAESYMPSMSSYGKKQYRKLLRVNHMSLQRGGGIISNFRNTGDLERAHAALTGFAERLVAAPQAFGLRADLFTRGNRTVMDASGKVVRPSAASRILMQGGILSEAMAWDALNINVPKNVPISTNQLSILNQYGMTSSTSELLGRRKLAGDAKATEAYKIALGQYVRRGSRMASNMPVIGIEEWPMALGAADWRTSGRVQENFLINLEVAGSQMTGRALRRELGISNLHIPVPGVNTDFWHAQYRTATGTYASSEAWTSPLQNFLKSVDEMHGGVDSAPAARRYLSQYLRAIRATDANLTVGRGGAVYDAGASIAGRMSFRDYGTLYKGHSRLGGRTAGFLVGINPKDFNRLAGNADFAEALFTRFPATTVDPIYMIADESVALGEMAMDESRRAKMGADFDGDTGYASIVKSKGATAEVRGIVGGGAAARAYDEAQDARMLLGGVADDLTLLGEASKRSGRSVFSNIAEAVTSRFSKFTGIMRQTEGQLLAKSYTQYIGRFSNLANEYIMAGTAMDAKAQVARSQLLRDIQQAAIDFGRASKGKVDPRIISGWLAKSIEYAASDNIPAANELFSHVMEKLHVGEGLDANLAILRSTYKGNEARIATLETLADELADARTGFFNPMRGNLEMQQEFGRIAEAQSLLQRRVYTSAGVETGSVEEVSEALTGIGTHLDAQAGLTDQGVPSIGRASAGESGARLTAWNRTKSAAAGTRHIMGDMWRSAKASPHFGTARAGLMATGGLMVANWMFNSASDIQPPAYSGRQRSLQQSPDVAMAGMNGAPMPGSAYGHAHRGGEMRNPRRTNKPPMPQNTIPRRYYVNQTNRVPRIRFNGSGDPLDRNLLATDTAAHLQRMTGGDARINVVHDATSRRMSELQFDDKMREDLRGGR